MDKDLNDDMLKLVRYNVLCVYREHEVIFPQDEVIVEDRMDEAGFTAWKMAEFMEKVGKGEVSLPQLWKDKIKNNTLPKGIEFDEKTLTVKGITGEPRKYLRVSYHVVDRYPRERFKYEELQIEALRDISGRIPSDAVVVAPGATVKIENPGK